MERIDYLVYKYPNVKFTIVFNYNYLCEKQKMENKQQDKNSKLKFWFKRVGWAGLAFFTIKGLVWLAIFYFGAEALDGCSS